MRVVGAGSSRRGVFAAAEVGVEAIFVGDGRPLARVSGDGDGQSQTGPARDRWRRRRCAGTGVLAHASLRPGKIADLNLIRVERRAVERDDKAPGLAVIVRADPVMNVIAKRLAAAAGPRR